MAKEMAVRIGLRIAQARDEADFTQAELAAKIPGKTTGDQLSKWERGIHRPGDDTLEHIARIVKKDIGWFFMPEPDKTETPDLVTALNGESDTQLDRIEKAIEKLTAEIADLGLAVDALAEIRPDDDISDSSDQSQDEPPP